MSVMKKNAGKNFNLKDDKEILSIDSPRQNVLGPWLVVYKNVPDRWAIVILHYDTKPCLGIRWFYGNTGTPAVRGFATWFIIPELMVESIVDKLPIDDKLRQKTYEILSGKVSISVLLKERYI